MDQNLLVAVTLFGIGFLALMSHRISEPPVRTAVESHPLGAFRAASEIFMEFDAATTEG